MLLLLAGNVDRFGLFANLLARRHAGYNILLPVVATFAMTHELVLAVVADAACIAVVRLFFEMAPLVVVAVADRGEALVAVFALVRLFAGVNAHVNQKVSALVEKFLAVSAFVVAGPEIANLHALDLATSPDGGRVRRVRGDVVLNFAGGAALKGNLAERASAGAEGRAGAELLDQNYVFTADVLKDI